MKGSVHAVIVACAAVWSGAPAHAADELQLSLQYESDPALADCPSGPDFRRDVVRQLGHDPFRDGAARRIVVRFAAPGGRMEGRVEWRDADGEWEGERTFSSRNEGCARLARAVALATAIQIQLLAGIGGSAQPAPSEGSSPAPTTRDAAKPSVDAPVQVITEAPTPAATASKEPRIGVDVGMGVLEDAGNAPLFVAPRLAILLGRPASLGVRLALSGFGPGAEVSRPEGVAQLDRFALTLQLIQFFRPGHRIQPLLALGGGLQDVRVRGISTMPALAHGHEGNLFSGLVDGSGGVAFMVAARLSVVLEVEAFLFRPVRVEVGSTEGARLDGGALFAHGGFLARF